VLGSTTLVLNAFGAILAFMVGAGSCAVLVNWSRRHRLHSVYALPLLLVMGLQNAVASKTSGGSVRTTHMTGNITDLGMELGKWLYWARSNHAPSRLQVRRNRQRMGIAGGLVAMFVLGGITGALGFKHVGFVFVVPLAALLLGLSVPPLLRDAARARALVDRLTGDAAREAQR